MNLTESWSHAVEWCGREDKKLSLCQVELYDVLSSMPRCPPGSLRSVQCWIIWSKWEIELCIISIEMVGEAMCLYDGTQCSACGEEEGSKNRSLGNPSDQLMCFGYLPSPGHLERPTSEIGFKPAKWNPSDVQWWEGGQEDPMIDSLKRADRSSRMRTDDLESPFAIRRASVTESSAVSVEWPLLKPDCLASSLLVKETMRPGWRQLIRVFWLWMKERDRSVVFYKRSV